MIYSSCEGLMDVLNSFNTKPAIWEIHASGWNDSLCFLPPPKVLTYLYVDGHLMSLFLAFLVLSLPPQLCSLSSSCHFVWIYCIIEEKFSCFVVAVCSSLHFFRQLNSRMQVCGFFFPYLSFHSKINERIT